MKLTSPNAEASRLAVRELSEGVARPGFVPERRLCCIPVQRTAHDHLAAKARVYRPWLGTWSESFFHPHGGKPAAHVPKGFLA